MNVRIKSCLLRNSQRSRYFVRRLQGRASRASRP